MRPFSLRTGSAWRASLFVLAPLIGPAAGTCAAQGPVPPHLGTIFVTATRAPQPVEQLIADVTILDADEIARSGAQSLAELLQRQAGIEILQNGGPGSTSGVLIRGANRGQTLLLIDGLRVSSGSVGAPSLEAVPLDQVERIEILRGPASSLYGADAIGGVIQIFTRRPTGHFSGNVRAGYGTYRTRTLTGGLSGAVGALQFSVQAGTRRSDGFNATTDAAAFIFNPDRDGYASDDIGATAALTFAPGHEASFKVLRNRLDAQFDGGPDFDDRTLTTLETWQLVSRNRLSDAWMSRLSIGESRDDSVSKGAVGDFPFRTRQRQYAWQNDVDVPRGSVSLAVERREEQIEEDAGFAVRNRNTNAVTGVWQIRQGSQALQANLRHDRSDQYGGETTGSLAWAWRLAPDWRVTVSYGTAFKPPSFNDLYFPGFSNPALEPERSRNVEAGLYWRRGVGDASLEARAVAWRNNVDDLIVFQCDESFNCLPRNVADAKLTGVTLGFDATWEQTTLRTSLDLQNPEDAATGNTLPRRAQRHGVIVLMQRWRATRLAVEVIASSHRFDDAENLRRLPGYALVNLTAEWEVRRNLSLFLRGDNVGDRDYAIAYGYATPGAQWFAGVRWQP